VSAGARRREQAWRLCVLALLVLSLALALHGGETIEAIFIAPLVLFYLGLVVFWLYWDWRKGDARRGHQ
jgi:hypothetical protein